MTLTKKLADQLANELTLAPAARTRVGKISALISQKTGPKLMADAYSRGGENGTGHARKACLFKDGGSIVTSPQA